MSSSLKGADRRAIEEREGDADDIWNCRPLAVSAGGEESERGLELARIGVSVRRKD
jgi:hypothetical protein